jgi:hypothetical protein
MRRGISLFVILALIGCASEDLPSEKLAGTPSPGGDVTGTWTMTWGTLVGTNTYPDTFVVAGGKDSIVTRTVRDTCTGTGTLTLTQHTPVAYVTGPYAITRTCTSHFVNHLGNDSLLIGTVVTTPADSVRKANMGSGELAFALDKATVPREVQLGLVSGSAISGTVQWNMFMATRPTKGRGVVRGTFSGTKP